MLVRPVVHGLHGLDPVAGPAQRLDVADVVRPSPGQRDDMVSLQQDIFGSATQALVAIPLAELLKLPDCKVAGTCVLCGPSLATVVCLELPDLLGVVLSPLFATGDDFVAVALVVFAFVGGGSGSVSLCSNLLILGDLLLMLFLVLSTRLDPVGQVGPRSLVPCVLPPMAVIVSSRLCFDARLALAHPPV